jgi:hypothetical protein
MSNNMGNKKTGAIVGGGVLLIAILYASIAGSIAYPDTDTGEIDRSQLFEITEKLLAESDAWPAELQDETVQVASSLDPYPVRTVRYWIEVEGDMERAIEVIREESYSGPGRRERLDKYEETLLTRENEDGPYEWVRRSVHLAPPPGGNRDAVVMYFEDRPDSKTYRLAFQSVETIDGKSFPEVEDAVRFKVLPSMFKVEDIGSGKVRIRKVEAVDPRGAMSPLMNNYIISKVFFRRYMFQQAQDLRDKLIGAKS